MADAYVGQIICVGFNFVPVGWLACDGKTHPISEYQPLFNVIGKQYGGDGTSNFAVPNLQNNITVGTGTGYALGQTGGVAFVTLNQSQMAHSHPVMAASAPANIKDPSRDVIMANLAGGDASKVNVYAPYNASTQTALHPHAVGPLPGNPTHENRQPVLGVGFIICYQGPPP